MLSISHSLTGAFLAIGMLGGLYFFWKKAKEEHFELMDSFDGVAVATLAGMIMARASYVILHAVDFGFAPLKWVQFWGYPGMWAPAGLLVFFWALARWADKNKLDVWEVWDFVSLFLAWFFLWYWLSRFALGSAAGTPTALPWGIVFPLRVEAAHPVQLYAVSIFVMLFSYLWWAEPRYRFFLWYRSKKRTARTGFLFSFFVLGVSLLSFLLTFVQYPFLLIWDVDLNQIVYGLLFFLGCGLLYVRSGRTFFTLKTKKERVGYASSQTSSD